MVISLDDPDALLVLVGLMLLDELLFKSRFDPDIQAEVKRRTQALIEAIHKARTNDNQGDISPQET